MTRRTIGLIWLIAAIVLLSGEHRCWAVFVSYDATADGRYLELGTVLCSDHDHQYDAPAHAYFQYSGDPHMPADTGVDTWAGLQTVQANSVAVQSQLYGYTWFPTGDVESSAAYAANVTLGGLQGLPEGEPLQALATAVWHSGMSESPNLDGRARIWRGSTLLMELSPSVTSGTFPVFRDETLAVELTHSDASYAGSGGQTMFLSYLDFSLQIVPEPAGLLLVLAAGSFVLPHRPRR